MTTALRSAQLRAAATPPAGGPRASSHRIAIGPSAAVLLATLLGSGPAGAQTAGNPPADAKNSPKTNNGLEEIVVNATRRDELVQNVPVAISAFSAADIEASRIVGMQDFATRVPGITYIPYTGNESYFIIRGVSTLDDSTGTSQPVVTLIDDVATTGVADLQPDLFDLDHIEVLKGPQGTLFGRNAVGGVVSIYTKAPTFDTDGKAEVTYGNYNLVEAKGMFNTPLIPEKLAARFDFTTHNRDGYIDDTITHDKIGYENRYTLRGKVLFTPTDDLKNVLSADWLREKSSSAPWLQGNFTPELEPNIVYSPTAIASPIHPTYNRNILGLSNRLDWTNALGTLTSITGFRDVQSTLHNTLGDPGTVDVYTIPSHDKQYSEELRLTSRSDQALTWVTGLYYLHSYKERPVYGNGRTLPGSLLDGSAPTEYFTSTIDQNTTTQSYAVFGEGTYAFTPKLALTLGGRYTYESKSGFSSLDPADYFSGPYVSANYSNSWSRFTPKVSLTYHATEDLMTYATVSNAYESGGYNVQGTTQLALQTPFNPEFVWNYELGAKYDGLDHRLQWDLAAFLANYTDLQVIEYNGRTQEPITSNAGSARVKGVELNVSGSPVSWLTLGVNYAYLDGRYRDYVIDNGPGEAPTINTGNRTPYTPRNAVTARADLHFPTPALRGQLEFGTDITYRSSMELDAENSEPQFIRGLTVWHGLMNAHGTWVRDDDRYEVSLWVKNLRNTHFTTDGLDIGALVQTTAEYLNPNNRLYYLIGNPVRTFGVTLRVNL